MGDRAGVGSIAGWPAAWERIPVAGHAIEMLTVPSLETLLDRERLLRDDAFEPPYWALLWSGARLVAEWLVEEGVCRGKSVLDVGCGLGLVALTAAREGGLVTAVDRDPDALAFLRESARRTGRSVEIVEGDVVVAVRQRSFDVVVAAELLYERGAFQPIARSLADCLSPSGVVFLGDAFRIDTRDFYEELAAAGLECVEERGHVVDEEGTRVRIRLGKYRRAAGWG